MRIVRQTLSEMWRDSEEDFVEYSDYKELLEEIANLKAALADERERTQNLRWMLDDLGK